MPISTRWYGDEQRVIYQKFEGSWTWEEFIRELAVMNDLADSVSYNIVLFTDMSQTNLMPKGNALAQGRSVIGRMPPNASHVILVIHSRLIEVFAGIVVDMIPNWRNRVQFVKTIEEGQKLMMAAVAANQAGLGAS